MGGRFLTSFVWVICFIILHTVYASFRITCKALVTNVRVDPILYPGKISPHDHTFMGASAVSAWTTTGEALRNSSCFTCSGPDKSVYWVPTLMYLQSDGQQIDLPVLAGAAYWDNTVRGTTQFLDVTPFPLGLRMVEGNNWAQQESDAAPRYSWQCGGTYFKTWPDKPCTTGFVRFNIGFKDCWNGQDLYLPESAHMNYSSDADGSCPPSHPVRTWTLRIEVDYKLLPGMTWSGTDAVPLMLGRPEYTSVYGSHADFVNGISTAEQLQLLASTRDSMADSNNLGTPAPNETCTADSVQPFMKNPGTAATRVPQQPPSNISGMYQFAGCYQDSGARGLPFFLGDQHFSAYSCYLRARGLGFPFFGVQAFAECWGGMGLPNKPLADNASCTWVCTGQRTVQGAQATGFECGALGTNAVYKVVGGVTVFGAPPTPPAVVAPRSESGQLAGNMVGAWAGAGIGFVLLALLSVFLGLVWRRRRQALLQPPGSDSGKGFLESFSHIKDHDLSSHNLPMAAPQQAPGQSPARTWFAHPAPGTALKEGSRNFFVAMAGRAQAAGPGRDIYTARPSIYSPAPSLLPAGLPKPRARAADSDKAAAARQPPPPPPQRMTGPPPPRWGAPSPQPGYAQSGGPTRPPYNAPPARPPYTNTPPPVRTPPNMRGRSPQLGYPIQDYGPGRGPMAPVQGPHPPPPRAPPRYGDGRDGLRLYGGNGGPAQGRYQTQSRPLGEGVSHEDVHMEVRLAAAHAHPGYMRQLPRNAVAPLDAE